MGQAQINVRTRACSRTSIARTKQAALTHNVRGKELIFSLMSSVQNNGFAQKYKKIQPGRIFTKHVYLPEVKYNELLTIREASGISARISSM